MFTLRFFKTTRMALDRILGKPISNELSISRPMDGFNVSHENSINSVRRIFAERGYQELESNSALDEQYLLFTRNDVLHLVYYLPYENYVTTIEIQACWEAQRRLGAKSSSLAAPHEFSPAAKDKAAKLGIEWLVV